MSTLHQNHVQRLVYAGLGTSVAVAMAITAFFLSRLVGQLDDIEKRTGSLERRVDGNDTRLNGHDGTDRQILEEQRNIKRLIQRP